MTVPVLLIIFNRPELTRQVLEAIARVKPKTLLVAADGPRFSEEAALCEQTRKLINRADWGCNIRTNFSDTNLGCGVRVYTAIDWAMSQFEELIILEDDCIPEPSFFYYCRSLLEYYRHDERIMHISGNNFQAGQSRTKYSYYFSKYTHAWGWATWKRAWRHFDWQMKSWPDLRKQGLVETFCNDEYEQKYWNEILDRMHEGAPDVWDYQWNYACWSQNGLAILPNKNLVSNIGVGEDATHTRGGSPFMNLPTQAILEISHPPFVNRNREADQYTFDHNFGGEAMKEADAWQSRLKKQLRPLSLPFRAARRFWRWLSSRGSRLTRK